MNLTTSPKNNLGLSAAWEPPLSKRVYHCVPCSVTTKKISRAFKISTSQIRQESFKALKKIKRHLLQLIQLIHNFIKTIFKGRHSKHKHNKIEGLKYISPQSAPAYRPEDLTLDRCPSAAFLKIVEYLPVKDNLSLSHTSKEMYVRTLEAPIWSYLKDMFSIPGTSVDSRVKNKALECLSFFEFNDHGGMSIKTPESVFRAFELYPKKAWAVITHTDCKGVFYYRQECEEIKMITIDSDTSKEHMQLITKIANDPTWMNFEMITNEAFNTP